MPETIAPSTPEQESPKAGTAELSAIVNAYDTNESLSDRRTALREALAAGGDKKAFRTVYDMNNVAIKAFVNEARARLQELEAPEPEAPDTEPEATKNETGATPEIDEATDDDAVYTSGQAIAVRRNAYHEDGTLDRDTPGALEEDWQIDHKTEDGNYLVVKENGALHDGTQGRLNRIVSKGELDNWQHEAERLAKLDAAQKALAAELGLVEEFDIAPAVEAAKTTADETDEVADDIVDDEVSDESAEIAPTPEEERKSYRERLREKRAERRKNREQAKERKQQRKADKAQARAEAKAAAERVAQDKRKKEVLDYVSEIREDRVQRGRVGKALRTALAKLKNVAAPYFSIDNGYLNRSLPGTDSGVEIDNQADKQLAVDAVNKLGEATPDTAPEADTKYSTDYLMALARITKQVNSNGGTITEDDIRGALKAGEDRARKKQEQQEKEVA